VEGKGVAPDVEVEEDPGLWRRGRDAQLEKAVEVGLGELARHPPPKHPRPPYPRPAR
jgi:tricorn protease